MRPPPVRFSYSEKMTLVRHFITVFIMMLPVIFFLSLAVCAEEAAGRIPQILINEKPGTVTVQDLSGLATRPLRLLINRNNKTRGEGFFEVYALGVRTGDKLSAELPVRTPGMRVTVYRIAHETGGPRYLSMPLSVYFPEAKAGTFQETIEPLKEEFLIFVYEKPSKPDEKNIQIRYFEERVRKLVIASYKTNLFFSSLKLKMRDFTGGETENFFERDAQLLIDRMDNPQNIVLVRLWRADK